MSNIRDDILSKYTFSRSGIDSQGADSSATSLSAGRSWCHLSVATNREDTVPDSYGLSSGASSDSSPVEGLRHLISEMGISWKTAEDIHVFVMRTLHSLSSQEKGAENGVLRANFGNQAAHLEVIIELQTGSVFIKKGYDEVLGSGTSKAAILAYTYFSGEEKVILRSIKTLNVEPKEAVAVDVTQPSVRLTQENRASPLEQSAPTPSDAAPDQRTFVVHDQEASFAEKKQTELDKVLSAISKSEGETDSTMAVYADNAENRAEEQPWVAPWVAMADNMVEPTDASQATASTQQPYSSPLEKLTQEERERFIAKDLSGLAGIMNSLFVDEDSGDIYQERAGDDFEKVLEQTEPSDPKRSQIMIGALEGLVNMHEKGYIHRDLKPGNLLSLQGRGVISDFGSACHVDGDSQIDEYVSTPSYGAPELFVMSNFMRERSGRSTSGASSQEHVTQKADIWSMGLIRKRQAKPSCA